MKYFVHRVLSEIRVAIADGDGCDVGSITRLKLDKHKAASSGNTLHPEVMLAEVCMNEGRLKLEPTVKNSRCTRGFDFLQSRRCNTGS
jgi:hypothetical protein